MYREYLYSGKNPDEIYAPDRVLPKGETPFRDEYEEYIKKCGKKNGVIEASIKEIRRRYFDHIHNNDFADLSEVVLQDQLNQNQK